ncbi:MAG: cysteine--tRNA ligase [Pseudomonadota bacterium]
MQSDLTLYNSLSRQKDVFKPIDANNVRMYVCGPTVYDFAHIGNARPVVVFDLLYRLLRDKYGSDHVTYVRNITDIDDKIMNRAAEENIDIMTLTQRTTEYFHADTDALGVLRPNHEPRATEYVEQMIGMISTLMEKEYAYATEGHVLFHTPSMEDYGKLSRRSLDDMIAGARVEVAPFKKDPTDFVLWKPSDNEQMGWQSPWGYGRPGWHIECSAMAGKLLGDTFDIHGGGIDLIFPHHENEIAQSCCTTGKPYVNYWMHNGFLQINGQKMSKSLGNFFTIRQLLTEKNIAGEVVKLLLLRTHYRQPLDWTDDGVTECQNILEKWFSKIEDISEVKAGLPEAVKNALYDDLNMPAAIAEMHHLSPEDLARCLKFLGFEKTLRTGKLSEADIKALIDARNQARADKDFAKSDAIRDQLLEDGVHLKDTRDGTSWTRK